MGHSKHKHNNYASVSKIDDPKMTATWDLYRTASGEIFGVGSKPPDPYTWNHNKEVLKTYGRNLLSTLVATKILK